MPGWIAALLVYGIALGFFRLLGGFAGAAEALRRWGRASASHTSRPTSPSG